MALVVVGKAPEPLLRRTTTNPEVWMVMARSISRSLSTSVAIRFPAGPGKGSSTGAPNPPLPLPNMMAMPLPVERPIVTAMSGIVSPLKSASASVALAALTDPTENTVGPEKDGDEQTA